MRTFPDRPPVSPPELAQSSGFPARGVPFSVLLHLTLTGAFLLFGTVPSFQRAPTRRAVRELALSAKLQSLHSPSAGKEVSASKDGAEPASHAVASRSMAASFVGPQHVISDTRAPDNSVQTILQPDVVAPRRLPYPLAIPSVVKLAMPQPSIALPVAEVRVPVQAVAPAPPPPRTWTPPKVHSPVETTPVTAPELLVAAPKLPVLASPISNYAPQPTPPPAPPKPSPEPAVPDTVAQVPTKVPPSRTPAPVPATQPSAASQEQNKAAAAKAILPSGNGKDDRNLLVVNAIETQSPANDQLIGQNEIHGRFEVAPVALPTQAKGSSGDSRPDKKPGSDAGISSATGQSPSAASTNAGQVGGRGSVASGAPASTSPSGKGQGTGSRGTSSGAAPSGTSGNSSPFGSISIQGGSLSAGHGGGATEKPAAAQPPSQHGSYGMTIVSSGSSGGGLRDFGAFRDGPVYTVYLDVSSLGIKGTRWSLQYGAAREVRLAHPGALLTPPFPSHQVLPKFPAERVASNLTRLFVIQAEISAEGNMESIQILQSPDLTLNSLLKDCLLKWSFQSASMGADPVAVRVLIGIPIAAVMAEAPQSTQ